MWPLSLWLGTLALPVIPPDVTSDPKPLLSPGNVPVTLSRPSTGVRGHTQGEEQLD